MNGKSRLHNLKELQKKWDDMPELEPWRAAQRHIAQQGVENVYTGEQLALLQKGTGGILLEALTKHGLYPKELENLSSVALQLHEQRQGEFSSNLRTLVEVHQKSRNPNMGNLLFVNN